MISERRHLEQKLRSRCYTCKASGYEPHEFYPYLCRRCGNENHAKRQQTCDLSGFVCVVTGARLKIGFQVALKLLRAGARVIGTSRFPADAVARYAREVDYEQWQDRIAVHGIDFRQAKAVERFLDEVAARNAQIDVIVNNAAQTVRRPPLFYRHLVEGESRLGELQLANQQPNGNGLSATAADHAIVASQCVDSFGAMLVPHATSAALSQVPLLPDDLVADTPFFPANVFDKDGQQQDRRPTNSWMMKLGDVSLIELMEVLYINVVAPFLICTRLRHLMRRASKASYVVNVTSMEGNFHDPEKNCRHPHTNMAKAALNMMTRTVAEEYATDRIFMTSVDTGWITNEKPFPLEMPESERIDRLAIDDVDGAARVCDPIFLGEGSQQYIYGSLLKNYRIYPW